MKVKVFVGKLGNEQFLGDVKFDHTPHKGDLIFYNDETYDILYTMHDIENQELRAFVKVHCWED